MTFILSVKLPEGIIIYADSRITFSSPNGMKKRMDVSLKIYKLSDYICVSFAGDVTMAANIISLLNKAIVANPKLQYYEYLNPKVEKLINYAYNKTSNKTAIKPNVSLLLAGISERDLFKNYKKEFESASIETELNVNEITSYLSIYRFMNKKIRCTKTTFENGEIATLGSGSKLVKEKNIKELEKNNKNYDLGYLLEGSPFEGFLKNKAFVLQAFFEDLIRINKPYDVGGIIQRICINSDGINRNGKYNINKKGGLIFQEGYNGYYWGKVDKSSNKIFKLLNCEDIIKIKNSEIRDILLE